MILCHGPIRNWNSLDLCLLFLLFSYIAAYFNIGTIRLDPCTQNQLSSPNNNISPPFNGGSGVVFSNRMNFCWSYGSTSSISYLLVLWFLTHSNSLFLYLKQYPVPSFTFHLTWCCGIVLLAFYMWVWI